MFRTIPSSTSWAKPVTLALFILLISFQLTKAFNTPLWIDSAMFAIAAKSVAFGQGYSAVFYNQLFPFSPGITCGPVVILATALMIKLLGNAFWVPGFTIILLTGILFVIAFRQLKTVVDNPVIRWQAAALFLLAVMLLTNHDIDNPSEKMLLWHALLGEIPSALFVITGILYSARHRGNPQGLAIGGLLLSLGGLCKLQAFIAVPVVGLCLAISYCRPPHSVKSGRAIQNIIAYGIGVVSLPILFEIAKIIGIGGVDAYLRMMAELARVTQDLNFTPRPDIILGKFYVLAEYMGITHVPPDAGGLGHLLSRLILAFVMWLCIKSIIFCKHYCADHLTFRTSSAEWAIGVLLCCCIAHFAWWLFVFSLTMSRYTTQGIFYGCAALALWMSQCAIHNPAKGNIAFLVVILFLCCVRYDAVAYFWTAINHNDALQEEQQALHVLKTAQERNPNLVIFSCGNAMEMEYLMPETGNFLNCDLMSQAFLATHEAVLLSSYTITPGRMPNMIPASGGPPFLLPSVWRDNPDNVRKLCPRNDRYAGEHYFIASCPAH